MYNLTCHVHKRGSNAVIGWMMNKKVWGELQESWPEGMLIKVEVHHM